MVGEIKVLGNYRTNAGNFQTTGTVQISELYELNDVLNSYDMTTLTTLTETSSIFSI